MRSAWTPPGRSSIALPATPTVTPLADAPVGSAMPPTGEDAARRGEAPGGRDAAAVAVARQAARVVDRHDREPARLDAAHAVRQAGLHPGLRARLVARREHHHAAPCDIRARSVDPARQGGLQ